MTTIFIVFMYRDYEGSYVEGGFSTEEKANDYVKKLERLRDGGHGSPFFKSDTFSVNSFVIDLEHH